MGLASIVIDRGCFLLFIATVISVFYKHLCIGHNDPYNCDSVLTQGKWLNLAEPAAGVTYSNWSPSTCMMHKYSSNDIQQCIGERKIVFIGDSQVRQIFWAMATKLDRQQAEREMAAAEKHIDLAFKGPAHLQLDFVWDPYLNSTNLSKELTMASLEDARTLDGNSSSIIVLGGGLWFAKNLEDFSLQRFSESVEHILHTLGVYERNHSQLRYFPEPLPQDDHTDSLVLLAPAQKPFYGSLDSAHTKTITPDRFELLHQKLLQIWRQQRIPVLWAYDLMTNVSGIHKPDGLHVTDNIADSMADLILNIKCNSFLMMSRGYPMDKTCCSQYPTMDKTQVALIHATWTFPVIAWLLPWILTKIAEISPNGISRASRRSDNSIPYAMQLLEYLPQLKTSKAIAVLLLTSCYCWLADRTHLYKKVQKQYSTEEFMVLCVISLLMGILSLYRSKVPAPKNKGGPDTIPDDLFLSRDQTDEWKGWMQVLILIYHYTGASQVLWIYKIIRLLVAAYLFLTGYGHTIYFLRKADYSLKRLAGVMLRLNMLSCILPYAMQTDYMFYYFAPLVSFWYLVVYATLVIGKSWNSNLLLLTLKIVMSAIISTYLISWRPDIFQSTFEFLSRFCNIHWDAKDWQFRLSLDRYIVYVGMLIAAYRVQDQSNSASASSDDRNPVVFSESNINLGISTLNWCIDRLRDTRLVYLIVACSGCLFYIFCAYPTVTKEDHNKVFSVASIGPILAFIALRNSFPWTRRFYSTVFAWIGRHSLETFVLQFHIWLAADTKGVLSTGLFDRSQRSEKWADFALLTVLFLWVCWHAADAIQKLTAFLVEPKSADRASGSNSELPIRKGEKSFDEVSVKTEATMLPGDVTNVVVNRLGQIMRFLRDTIAASLFARLVLILIVLWATNMCK